jgi:general secretion pathway protein J
MDRTLGTPPFRRVLLDGVERFEMTFLEDDGNAHIDWPPLNSSQPVPGQNNLTLRPRAARISVQLEGYGTVWRLIEVAG